MKRPTLTGGVHVKAPDGTLTRAEVQDPRQAKAPPEAAAESSPPPKAAAKRPPPQRKPKGDK